MNKLLLSVLVGSIGLAGATAHAQSRGSADTARSPTRATGSVDSPDYAGPSPSDNAAQPPRGVNADVANHPMSDSTLQNSRPATGATSSRGASGSGRNPASNGGASGSSAAQ